MKLRNTQLPAVALLGVVGGLIFLQVLAQAIQKCRKCCNPGKKIKMWGPWQLWVDYFLTVCPCLAMIGGILLPAGFSTAGLIASDFWVNVNLEFSTYLAAELPDQYRLDIVNEIARDQKTRAEDIRDRADRWAGWNYAEAEQELLANSSNSSGGRRLGEAMGAHERRLQTQNVRLWKLELFYQAKDPERGIFTPEALEEIRDFENRILNRADYAKFCTKRFVEGECDRPYSATNIFFSLPDAATASDTMQVVYDGSGNLADIDTVLRGFLRDGVNYWVDKDFGPQNLKSQYTRATFQGGVPLDGYNGINDRIDEQRAEHSRYLLKLWEELLHRTDLKGADRLEYEHVIFTWVEGFELYSHEVTYYLINDCLFCAGTFVIVSSLVLLRMQNIFIGFFGALGVILAFTTTYYFHYEIMGWHSLTVLDFVSLFLIVGISADDILLLYNTYMLAPVILGPKTTPRKRMAWAYREAASAMLVTSVTTCGSFYSNCFSVVSVVRAFGFFMGTLVVWNFINVLTIFPSAILVNDCYIIPCLKCCCCCCCQDEGPGVAKEDTNDSAVRMKGSLMKTAAKVSRQFSKEQRSTLEIDVETSNQLSHDKLECMERMVARWFTPLLVNCRWLLLLCSLSLSGSFIYLAYEGFTLSSGELLLFKNDINLGRIEKMQSEVFPGNTVADLNQALSVQNPYATNDVPTCPRSNDNSTFCAGNGACDTSTGRCVCQDEWVGTGCTVTKVDGTLTLARWSPPSTAERYEYLLVLARPSLMQYPTSAEISQAILMVNAGDNAVQWGISVPSGQTWLAADPTSGSIPARVFTAGDVSLPGTGEVHLKFYLGGRAPGFAETANVAITSATPGISAKNVVVSAEILQPPVLTFLEVRAAEYAEPSSEVPVLSPDYDVEYGFSSDDSLNLALPGNAPEPVYNVSLPWAISRIEVATVLSLASSRVLVNGQESSGGISQPLGIAVEPTVTTVIIQVESATNSAVQTVYQLQVVRASTTTTTTAIPDFLYGAVTLTVDDCANLSSSQAAQEDLASGIATAASVNASMVAIDSVRCGARRLGDGQRQLSTSAVVDYLITIPQGVGVDPTTVKANIEAETPASLSAKLQSALNGGGSGLTVTVTAIAAPLLNPTTTTWTSTSSTGTTTATVTTVTLGPGETSTSRTTSTGTATSETSTTQTSTTQTSTTQTATTQTSTTQTSATQTTSTATTATETTSTQTATTQTSTTTTDTATTQTTSSVSNTVSSTTETYIGPTTTATETTRTVTQTSITTSSRTQTQTETSTSTATSATSSTSTASSTVSLTSTLTSTVSLTSTLTSTSLTQTSSTSSTGTATSTSYTTTSTSVTLTSSTITVTTRTITVTASGTETSTTTSSATTTTSTATATTATATSTTTTSTTTTSTTTTTATSTATTTYTDTSVTTTSTSSTGTTYTETRTTTSSLTSTITTSVTSATSSTGSTVTTTSSSVTATVSSTTTRSATTTTSSSVTRSSSATTTSTATVTSSSTQSSTVTSTRTSTTSTLENYNLISGSLSMEVSDCGALNTVEGRSGLATGIAQTANISAQYVDVTVTCSRRLELTDVLRRLMESAALDYLIDLPFETPSTVGQAASQSLEAETLVSLSATLQEAVVAAGVVDVSLNVTLVAPPSVEPKTTTTTTTLYCPGSPPCGGATAGSCVEAPPDDPLRRHWICECRETYNGTGCLERVCPVCQNNGTCASGEENLTAAWECDCPITHQGDRCEFLRCPGDCNNAGDCDKFTGICACFDGYSGDDCGFQPTQLVPITNAIELSLTWGLIGYEEDNNSAPLYDNSFDLFDPEVQEWILDTCTEARQNEHLMVRAEFVCWIEGFATWLQSTGGPFPVPNSELASEALQVFFHQTLASAFQGDVATDGVDYAGRPYFARVRMKINVAANADMDNRTEIRTRWDEWVAERNANAPASVGPMLMVSYFFTQMELESQVLTSTVIAFAGSMCTSLIAVAFFTQNAVIAFYVCLNIFLVVCVLAGFLLYWMEYEFGVVEAIGATIFVGLSVDYCLHLAHAYNEAPGRNALGKMKRTLVVIGPSIMGGAVTTIAGTAFLLPCRMILFQKLGWTLFANAIVSVLFTFTFLTPLFIVLGPTGTAGTIFCFPCLRRFAPEEHHHQVFSGSAVRDIAQDEEVPDNNMAIPETIREETEMVETEKTEKSGSRTPYSDAGVAPLHSGPDSDGGFEPSAPAEALQKELEVGGEEVEM